MVTKYYEEDSLYQLVLDILLLEGWSFDDDCERKQIYLEIQGINYDFHCILMIDDDQESILYYLNIFDKIPYMKRSEVCEFITRVNYNLNSGNFEMNLETGTIRFRSFLDLSNSSPSKEQVLNLIWHGVQCFDTYYPGLLSLVTDQITVQDAIDICEDHLP